MTKTNTRSRIVSILLVLMMLLTMVPITAVTANAADGFVEVSTYEELRNEVDKGSAKIKLTADIDTTSENSGVGVTTATNLSFKGSGNVLDLNGHKLKLVSKMSVYFIEILSSDLTIKDSGTNGRIDFEYGRGVLGVQRAIVISRSVGVKQAGSLTVDGGTLSSTYLAIILIESYGSITINGGRLYAPVTNSGNSCYIIHSTNRYDIDDTLQLHVNGGELDGRVVLERDDSSATGTLKYKVTPIKITDGTFKQGFYASWEDNGNPKNAEMTMDSPTVEITGGVFESNNDDGQRVSRCYIDLATKLRGGTFKDRVATIRFVGGEYTWEGSQPQYRASIGNSAILYGNDIRTAYDWSESDWFEILCPRITLIPGRGNSVTVIPNAWGMKSVTLDGKEIDYFKDWTGEWKRVKNDQDHTLVFEWYPLSSDMKNAGYTYDAKYLLHRTNSSTEPTPITVDTSKNTLKLKIEKGALPGGYSYDFRLDLKKDGGDLSSSTNQHIVMLVVDPAPVVDTRTPIDSVALNVPKLKEGDKSGGNFTLSGANTGVNSTVTTAWENIPESGAVAGNFYVARITLTAEDGYAFNTKTQVNLNGDYSSMRSGIDNGGAGMIIYVSVPVRHEHNFGPWQIAGTGNVHFRECSCGVQESKPHEWEYNDATGKYKCTVCEYEIDGEKESITHVYASPRSPIAGEHPGDYTAAEWVKIVGANYKVESIDWKNMDDTDVTTFEAGKIYKGTVTFKADTGFAFDGSRIYASQIFNSSNAEVVGNYALADGGTTLTATFKLKDEKVVRPGLNVKVKLPTLNDKIGQSFPAAELVDTTLPGDVELTTSVYENIFEDPITGSVAPNKTYFYAVKLQLKGGSDVTEAYNVSYTATDGGDAVYHTDNLAGYGILARYQTPDTSKISSVALTVTAPKYGEAPATSATGANDTLYTVGTPTWSPAVTDGKFGAAAYTVSIPVTAASGYSFDENGIYTINGYVADVTKNTDGSVTLSYAFPALTGPHTHNYTDQPWQYLNPGSHYQECKAGDGYNILAHEFTPWTDNENGTHSRHCTVCKMTDGSAYTETAEHTWVWVVDQEAALGQPGKQHEECTDCHAKRSENTEIPALRDYAVTVTGGTATVAAGTPITRAMEGVEVTVTAQAPDGKHFVKWVVKAGGVTLANATSATTTFIMPANDVTIEAECAENPVESYTLTVIKGTASVAAGTPITDKIEQNTVVTVTADAPETGKVFDKWVVLEGNVTLTDATKATTTFTMPGNAVKIEATYKDAPPSHTHSYGTEWKYDDTNHWHECSCGDKTDTAAHSFQWVIDKAATKEATGIKHEECTVCGAKRSENTVIPKDSGSPETGDSSNLIGWLAALFVSGGVLTLLGVSSKKRKESEVE